MSVCEMTLVGNVGRDPEVRYTAGGKSVTSLSVAVSNGTKNADGTWTNETDWFRVSVFGEMGERISETVKKGSRVLVIGRFKTRSYEKDGATKTSLEVVASRIVGLDKAGPAASGGAASEGDDDMASLKW